MAICDSLVTSGDAGSGLYKEDNGDSTKTYVWTHTVPACSHFFYVLKGSVKTGTDVKIYDCWLVRRRYGIELYDVVDN